MPAFSLPLALLGLAAVPALAAIYWLRSRSRRRVVSSLMLWVDQRRPPGGGRIFQRMILPLLFLLELGAIVATVVAAADPKVRRAGASRRLVVVLDDSYSMRAGGARGPRDQAVAAIEKELTDGKTLARFILAGMQPRLLGESVRSRPEAAAALAQWTCGAPDADLAAALALAGELAGPSGRMLVVTDHAPDEELEAGRVQWWSFGRPRANVAITAAARTPRGGQERLMLELANLSSQPARAALTITGGGLEPARQAEYAIPAGGRELVFLDLPPGAAALRARLNDDDLPIDNEAVLLPDRNRPVRVGLRVRTPELHQVLQQVLAATGLAVLAEDRFDLLISDQPASAPAGDAWALNLHCQPEALAYAGPFVADRLHPLTQGLSLDGVVWGVPKDLSLGGAMVVTAGNVTLLSDAERPDGHHDLHMGFCPRQSTLQDSPSWPILIWNLLGWRASELPGACRPNVRLGENVAVVVGPELKQAVHSPPGGQAEKLLPHARKLTVFAEATGIHRLRAGPQEMEFSCNALNPEESDLRACQPGRWGRWEDSAAFQREWWPLGWAFCLAAMGLLTAHAALVARSARSERT